MFSSSHLHLHRSSLFKNSLRFLQQQNIQHVSNTKKKRKLNFDELHAAATLTEQCSSSSSSPSSSSKTCFQIWNSFLSNQQKQQQPSGNIQNNNNKVSSPFTTNVLFGTVQLLDKSGNWNRAMELLAAGHFSLNETSAKKEAENYFAELKNKKQQSLDANKNNNNGKNSQNLTHVASATIASRKNVEDRKQKNEITTKIIEGDKNEECLQDRAEEKRLTFIQELILTSNSILEEQQRRQYRFDTNLRKMKSASSSSAEVARLSQSYQKERQERYQVFSRVFTAALDELSGTSNSSSSSSSSLPRNRAKKNFQQQQQRQTQKDQDEEFLEQNKKMREANLIFQLVSVCCKSHQLQQNYYCLSDVSGGNDGASDVKQKFFSSSVWTQDSEWPMLALDAALVRLLIVTSTPEEIISFSSATISRNIGNFSSSTSSFSSVPLIVACIAKCCTSQIGDNSTHHLSELFHNSLLSASSSSSSTVGSVSLFQIYDYYSARQQEIQQDTGATNSTPCDGFCLDDLALLFFRAFLVEPDLASSLVHQSKSAQEIFIVLEVVIAHFFIHSSVTGSPTKDTIDWNKQDASQIHGLHHDDAKSKMFGINRLLHVVRSVHQHEGGDNNNHHIKIENPKRIRNQTGKMAILQLWPFMTLLLDSILTDPSQNFARTDLRRILMVEDWLSTFNHLNADISQENTMKLVDYVVILCWESITSCVFSASSFSHSSSTAIDVAKATTSTLNIVKQAVAPSIRKCCDLLASLPIIERFENLASFIFVSSAVLGIDMHHENNNNNNSNNTNSLSKSNIALVLLRHAMFLEKNQLHPESLEGRDHEGLANSKKILELLEDCSNGETTSITSPLTEATFKKWLPYFDGSNNSSSTSSFCLAPTVAGSFYKLVFQALSRIQLQQQQSNDTTNEPQRAGFLMKDPNGRSFQKNSNTYTSTTPSYISYAPCWQRVLKLISSPNPKQQQQQQSRTLLFFTPHLQHAAFVACADTKSWVLGLTLYNITKTRGVSLQQSSVPIVLDFMRRMKNSAPILVNAKTNDPSNRVLPAKFRDKRTGDEWDLAVDPAETTGKNVIDEDGNEAGLCKNKPWFEAVRLVFSAYNLRVSDPRNGEQQKLHQTQTQTQNNEDQNDAFFSSPFAGLMNSIMTNNSNKNKSTVKSPNFVSSNNNTSSNNNIHYSHPHPLLMSRLSQIVSNHTKQFSPLSPQASTWQEVCFYFSVILHTEINHGGGGGITTNAPSNQNNYHGFQRNQQNQLINKSCGPDFFAPVLIRLADHGRWKEASIVASSMIASHKLVNPIQLVPFVSKSGLHSHWKDVLRGFADAVQQGYLAPPHAVATATCMAVNSFLSMPSELFLPEINPDEIRHHHREAGTPFNFETEKNSQNQQESSPSSVDAAYYGKNPNAIRNQHARVACVGVLHWMIKQRVFASKEQMTGQKENKKRIVDAVQAVCAENNTLLCSMLVQKCLNEL